MSAAEGKRAAAYKVKNFTTSQFTYLVCKHLIFFYKTQAVDDHVRDGDVVGMGSGSTVVFAAERMGQRAKQEGMKIKCIPTSFQVGGIQIHF